MATNNLAPKNINVLQKLANHPNPVQYLMQLASERPEYAALAEYLTTRSAMPPVSFGYLSPGTSGEFESNFWGGNLPRTGKVTLNSEFMDRAYAPTTAIPTLSHELVHASQKEMESQRMQKEILDQNAKQQFLDAYQKLVYDKTKPVKSRFGQNVLAEKLNPAWSKENEAYRASIAELPAFAIGTVSGKNDAYRAPEHLNPTLATEYQILLDLATRDAKANPYKKAR